MSTPDTAFVKQYQDTIAILAQQMDSRLRPCVMVDTNFRGEQKFYDQYASDSMVEIVSRYADTPVQVPDHRRRMVSPRYFVSNTLEDPVDALQMLIDPKSTYMQAKMFAAARQIDDLIITALGGTAYTGKTGSSSTTLVSWESGTHIVASSSVGMTKVKCISAKALLDKDEVEETDRFFVVRASQLADLLNTTEVTSSDYNVVKALVEGNLNTWLGFTWIRSERLASNGSTTYYTYAFQKKGLQLAIQKDVEGRVDERPDKNYAWQVYMRMCMGATRLEEARVVQVACVEIF